jgi:uncharacterized SAM-binding protein YcdF (DUF218 family)
MYIIKFIYSALLFPPGCFILGLLLFAWWRHRQRRPAGMPLLLALCLYLASAGFVGGSVLHSLETRYTPPAQVIGDVIIVLGAGATLDTPNVDSRGHLGGSAANRLLTGVQLYHKLGVPIIFSGGQIFATDGNESEVAKNILLTLGVPAGKIIAESASLNTADNARYTAAILRQQGFKNPILVTSAYHMERSVRQFAKAGVTVVPYPTDYQGNIESRFHHTILWPTTRSMQELVTGLKEYIGIAAVTWY